VRAAEVERVLDGELRDDLRVPELEVHELLVPEVLDDLDRRFQTSVADPTPPFASSTSSGRNPTSLPLPPIADVQHLGRHQVHRRRADERRDESVRGSGVHLLGGPDLLEHACAHHGDPITHRHRLDLVVRHVDRGRLEAVWSLRISRESGGAEPRREFESGSSMRNADGSRTIARPSATALRCPPESCFGLRFSRSPELEDVRGLAHAPSISAFGTSKFFS
jgi:hypothetical protein